MATQEVARSKGIGSLQAERLAKAVKAENSEEFNAVKAAHLMMTDEAGMQLPRSAASVREFERKNKFFEPFNGPLASAAHATQI
ncbi:hypothetical protein BH11CYA1_BH11CYA1_00420 [soil metagenome]